MHASRILSVRVIPNTKGQLNRFTTVPANRLSVTEGHAESCPGWDSDANSGRSDAARMVDGAGRFAHSMRGEKPSQSFPSFCPLEGSVGYPAVMARPWRHGHDAEHSI